MYERPQLNGFAVLAIVGIVVTTLTSCGFNGSPNLTQAPPALLPTSAPTQATPALAPLSTPTTAPSMPPATATGNRLKWSVTVTAGQPVNVRDKPSVTGAVVRTLNPGEKIESGDRTGVDP